MDDQYIKSCRIRTGRSVKGFCLPPAMCRAERRAVEKVVSDGLSGLEGDLKGKYFPLLTMSHEDQEKLIEDHFLFEQPTGMLLTTSGCARDWPDGRGIWYVRIVYVTSTFEDVRSQILWYLLFPFS